MAKTNIKEVKKENEDDQVSPQNQASSYFKANRDSHLNFEETIDGKTPSSSLILTSAVQGGIEPGCHRAVGTTTGGKTSCTLDFMYHFLKPTKGVRGIYVKAEGRLSKNVKERSGIKFVIDPDEWVDGTCFVVESNEYEFIFGFMGDLVRNNPTKTRYFFIIDSVDTMARKADLAKGLGDAVQVAGGALITSVFFKQSASALAKRGHVCWFISQVRDSIKINMYEKVLPRQGSSSGGHALEHQGDYVLEFLPRFGDDQILENPADKGSKRIGHYCRIKILKSNDEKYGVEIRYPIKYGRVGATSVWVEREIGDLLVMWEHVKKTSAKSAWLDILPPIRDEIKEATGVEAPDKVQGVNNLYQFLEENPKVTAYLFDKFSKLSA